MRYTNWFTMFEACSKEVSDDFNFSLQKPELNKMVGGRCVTGAQYLLTHFVQKGEKAVV